MNKLIDYLTEDNEYRSVGIVFMLSFFISITMSIQSEDEMVSVIFLMPVGGIFGGIFLNLLMSMQSGVLSTFMKGEDKSSEYNFRVLILAYLPVVVFIVVFYSLFESGFELIFIPSIALSSIFYVILIKWIENIDGE
ncbi:hypothetical protein V6R21_08175 [Limibacter armeniacum]|uniref:hypothetical protein n=1 Tax=Limibacter armeniacum TaxID=466084 RepID=UPI002FE54BE9